MFVADDEESIRTSLARLIRRAGHQVETSKSAVAYLRPDTTRRPTCLVLDVVMGGVGGLELHRAITGTPDPLPTIFISGCDCEDLGANATAPDVIAVLGKPLEGGIAESRYDSSTSAVHTWSNMA